MSKLDELPFPVDRRSARQTRRTVIHNKDRNGYRYDTADGQRIALSILDFKDEASMTDRKIFLPALFCGTSPAKAFRCGLLLGRI